MFGDLMGTKDLDVKYFCGKCKTYHRQDDVFACILTQVVG